MLSSYSERLRDPRWKAMRSKVLDALGHRCVGCGEYGGGLQVHHKRYVRGRMPWDYPMSDFAVLCRDCHMAEHPRQTLGLRLQRRLDSLAGSGPASQLEREALRRSIATTNGVLA